MATELFATSSAAIGPTAPTTVSWLVDNADAYRATVAAIGRAEQSVWLTQLAFDADCIVHDENDERMARPDRPLLLDALLAASARGVAVRIILNQSLLLDTVTPLRAALLRARAADIGVRGISRFPQLIHTKMLIVDEREAILLGSPFVNGYWDSADHPPVDERRPARELAGRPVHDLSMHVTGAPVRALGAVFAELWNDVSIGADADAPIECRAQGDPRPDDSTRVVRTAPGRIVRHRPDGATEIVVEIERGLAEASRLVYIEHQYLSSRRVIAAISTALQREARLEVVIVLNQNPDVTAYRGWQNVRLRDAGLLDHPRVGVFALWRAAPVFDGKHDWSVNQLFLHSKALIIDDMWLTAGSANLDGVSLHSYGDDFSGWLGRRVFRDVRNYDVNLVLRRDSAGLDNPIRELRELLWEEHLGTTERLPGARSAGQGLARWRAAGIAGVARLNAAPRRGDHGSSASIVLPYSIKPKPREQLRQAGLTAIERIDLRFDPGWVERHLSPNWVRNMFA